MMRRAFVTVLTALTSATDQDGVWSGWTYADSRCTVQSLTAASLDDRIAAPWTRTAGR